MAQARRSRTTRRSKRQGGAAKGLPGWAMLTIGLIIGLFVAFLVYLDDLEAPPGVVATAPPVGDGDAPAAEAEGTAETESEGPSFEFYSILPELEVVVPEAGPKPAEGAADEADDAAAGSPGLDGRYYLQAGSFREPEQADRRKAAIALLGLDVGIQEVLLDGERWHRVRVGPYTATADLRKAQARLREHDIEYLVLREKSSG